MTAWNSTLSSNDSIEQTIASLYGVRMFSCRLATTTES
jgi:hypothetical protein